ncbi:MAG: L-fucose isomerase [Chloroflexi bacterium]|nr:L-fucose isomerase [Chloroflexota bacterium]
MTADRFGVLPRIGIRPTIDAREGGVRESLEAQTIQLARALADTISGALRYPNGERVECVIADSTIGRVAEAAAADEKFRREDVGATISVTPAWCYGSETMDVDPLRPKAVWGFNGTERPGAVYLAAVLAAHAQQGLPAFGIYGRDVQDSGDVSVPDDIREKVLRFAKAAVASQLMRSRSYLSVGGTSMGIAGSIVDRAFFQRYLGMRVEAIDMTEILRRIERGIYDPAEFERAMEWVRVNCVEGTDYNRAEKQRSREELDRDWASSVKMALAMRDLMVGNPKLKEAGHGEESLGHNAILAGFQGQRQWTDFLPNGDFMEAILNSSFDWDGPRAPYVVATENDSLNGASMLFGHLLTNTAQIFADVRTYWSPEAVKRVAGHELGGVEAGGFLHLINSGPAALDATGQQTIDGRAAIKPFWELSEDEIAASLRATTWHPGLTEYFRGGGWSTRFRTRGGMPVTMCRINIYRGRPALQIAEGWTIELPDEVHAVLDDRTNPSWPTTWFVPRTEGDGVFRDVYSVMNAWGANHAAISHGHIGADLITLASILRVPVFMHNVDADQVFRPAAWNGFGTADAEGADFRACDAFGPLYG